MYKIAVDIGGTNIKVAVLDESLQMIAHQSHPTPDNQQTLIIDVVHRLVKHFIEQYKLSEPHIGISSAGVVNSDLRKIIYTGPTIQNYDGTDFFKALSDLSPHITLRNDVDAALLGELSLHDYDEDNIFCLTLGTGIGGAFYNKHHGIYTGSRYRANEIGYLLYRHEDQTTYEQRASTSALQSLISNYQFESKVNVPLLFELASQHHEEANRLLNDWSEKVAEGIAQIQIMYDPDLILIGGGISSQGQTLISYIEPKIHHYLPEDYGIAKIQTTKTENHAALYGAIS